MITSHEYWAEVRSLCDGLIKEAKAGELDTLDDATERLWETIDGHRWVIYTHYNWQVLCHSPNDGYAVENFGVETAVKDGALNTAALAFGALYADVSDALDMEAVEEAIAAHGAMGVIG